MSRWCAFPLCFVPRSLMVASGAQPGVADPDMEGLVNDKVEAFWRGVEGGHSKRGQVRRAAPGPGPRRG